MLKKTFAAFGAALVIVAVSTIPAGAVGNSYTWDGEGADDNWSTALNWNSDTTPGTDDTLVFSTATTTNNDMVAPYVVRRLDINNPGFDLSGNAIVVNSSIGIYDNATIRTDLTAAFDQPWFVDSGATFTITGDVDVDAAAILDFSSEGDTALDGELNGPGTAHKGGDGVLYLNGGGNIPGLDSGGAAVHVNSVLASTDVLLNGGYISGGTPGNLGAQQAIGELDAAGGFIAPGPATYGAGLGVMYLGGTFNGSFAATFEVEIEGAASDSILSAGVFNADGTQLDVTVGTVPAIGAELVIAESTDTTANSFFTKVGGGVLGEGAVVEAQGHFFRINYNTVDITLTYLGTTDPNAPAAALPPTGSDVTAPAIAIGVLLFAGLGLLFVARRRVTE